MIIVVFRTPHVLYNPIVIYRYLYYNDSIKNIMKALTIKWIQFAESDLQTAEYLLDNPKANQWTFLQVVWHCHQSIEKILKAIIVNKEKELLYIHDLPKLLKLTEIDDLVDKNKDWVFSLNKYYIAPRYPDLPLRQNYPLINKQKAKDTVKSTRELFICLKEYLK